MDGNKEHRQEKLQLQTIDMWVYNVASRLKTSLQYQRINERERVNARERVVVGGGEGMREDAHRCLALLCQSEQLCCGRRASVICGTGSCQAVDTRFLVKEEEGELELLVVAKGGQSIYAVNIVHPSG